MENNLSLNSGQYVLYGFLLTSIQGQRDSSYNNLLTVDDTIKLVKLVIELTGDEFYVDTIDCPDVRIMIHPQDAFQIFCDWYDENETYFEEFLVESN
jgi:hypothetical protein